MKLVGTKFLFLILSISFSGMSYADLRLPELAMQLSIKKTSHHPNEIIQFELTFTNQTDRDLTILLPGTQNKGKRILQLQVFSVNRSTNFYTKVFENPLQLEMDTSFVGSVQFKQLNAGESVRIPLFVNDYRNAQKYIYSNYSFPNLELGSYQVIAYYNPLSEPLSSYVFQPFDDHGRNIEEQMNPEKLQIDATGIYSNYVTLDVASASADQDNVLAQTVCSTHCRFCRHLEKEQWRQVEKDIDHRLQNMVPHDHVRFLFDGPDAIVLTLPTYYSREIVVETKNGIQYKELTWQIGKIYPLRSFLHTWYYLIFHRNAPFVVSNSKTWKFLHLK